MWILLFYDVSFDKWIEFKFIPEKLPTLVDTADIGKNISLRLIPPG